MQRSEHLSDDVLSAYGDAALPAEEAARAATHLALCADCRAELAAFSALRGALAALPVLSPSAAFVDRVLATLPQHPAWPTPAPARRGIRRVAWPVAALLANLALLAGLLAMANGPAVGLLVGWMTLAGTVEGWCVGVLVALPGGGALPAVAPVAATLLACIVLLSAALRLVVRGTTPPLGGLQP